MITVSKNWILKKGGERKRESKRKRRLAAEDTKYYCYQERKDVVR